ncbi:MAG: hypothetical protein V3R30_03380, partial [Kiloniellales bacterium]
MPVVKREAGDPDNLLAITPELNPSHRSLAGKLSHPPMPPAQRPSTHRGFGHNHESIYFSARKVR